MSLDDAIDESAASVRLRGRATRAMPPPLSVRDLESGEVEAQSNGEVGTKASPLQRITGRHRKLAQLLAGGMGPGAAAHAVGITPSRVSILLADQTFQDLVAHAKAEGDRAFVALNERMAALGETAAEEMQRRLDEEPESLEWEQLQDILRLTADRTGYGPKKVEERNINVNFGDALAAARQRVKEITAAAVEDAVVVPEKEPA